MFRFVLLWFCSVLTQFPVWVWFCLSIFPLLSLSSSFQLLNSITQDIFHSVPPVCGSRSGESCVGVVEDSEPSAADDYDVFLSFRGPDTRQGFTDVLYDTMKRAGIRVFRDDDEISIGQPLRKILHAIETSQICMPIFSQTFAKSSWCLREVARMIELKKVVMPIFYDVTPDDVKLKTKTYYKDLKMHKKNNGKEQVEMWEDALREVSRIKGKEVLTTRHTEFCKKLVDEGLSKFRPRKRSYDERLVGIDWQIKSVINLMDMGSPDVLYIAIQGMGGIGKTTLATALFENLSTDFDSSYFLRDVRESSLRCNGLQDLRNKLQVGLDPEFTKGCNSLRSIEERFRNKKVLIVLDDVDKLEQVEKLAGHSSWFGSGSRIIITTRDVDVLTRYAELDRSEVRLFEMRTLCPDQAFELFCRYAFREEKAPTIELEDISREIALKAGGLPLALKVIGSLLCNVRDEAVWRDVKSRLKTKPLEKVMDTLRISYEALKDDQKQIFLDIACLPVTIEKDRGIHMFPVFLLLSLYSPFQLLKAGCLNESTCCISRNDADESSEGVVDAEASSSSTDEYDVFLSFRGPDTRQGFTDVLYDTMKRAGIRVFRDDDEVSIGQPLRKILHAIETSQICVPIFSQTFAKSSWCLREVARMIELKKVVMPIFYDVTPNDVKLETEVYRNDLKMHENKYGKGKVKIWEDALREVSRIKGKEVLNIRYTEFCKKLVDEGLSKLRPRKRSYDESLIGIDRQIKSVINSMDMGSPDVLYIAIHGMGGIGKTTLATALFENLSIDFDSSYFLRDVRESSLRCNGLQDLRNQLQVGLDPEFTKGCNSLRSIEERFRNKKVLIVLDDVDKSGQIKRLAGQSSWFGFGSRIIVTTRNVDVLTKYAELNQGEVRLFEMRTLCHDQALELFRRYAFREEKAPTTELEDISREIVLKAGGLPLALEVIGSRLNNTRDKAVWKDVLRRLKTKPFGEVMDTLRISYEALEDDDQKQIFLDIACLPATLDKDRAIHMWEASKLYPHFNLAVLSSMSLVKLHDNRIWMHDLLKDLGKDIALKNGTRIWKTEQLLEVVHSKEGKGKIEALYIDKPLEACLTREDFANFRKLRFLHLVGSAIEGDFRYLLPNLTWLSWRLCPPILKITNLYLKNLVVLDFSFSFISESWGGWSLIENLNHLKELDLSNCHNLTTTPDFSKTNRLERLDLHHCSELSKIHSSIGKLQMLKYLDLLECHSLEGLPDEIGCLVNLKKLQVRQRRWGRKIKRDFSLPSSIGNLKSLMVLKLEYLEIVDIPYSIGGLANLEVLSLEGCQMMKDLPISLEKLDSLGELNLSYCSGITEIPNSIGGLVKLKILNLHYCSDLKILPESLGLLQEVKVLRLSFCHLRKLPVSIGLLSNLEVLEYDSRGVLEELPNEIGSLSRLRVLRLHGSSISTLPSSIRQLHFLEKLDLGKNHHLQELPDLPFSLRILRVSSKSLRKISDLSRLVNLMELHFLDMDDYRCPSQVPTSSKLEGIEKLTKLTRLRLSVANVTALQYDMCSLPLLNDLLIDFQTRSYAPASSLELLDNSEDNLWLKLPDLSRLKNLSTLCLEDWYIKDGVDRGLGIWNLGNVKSVLIDNCGIEIIEQTCRLKNLRSLVIIFCGSLKTLPDLSEMKLLHSLVVASCNTLVEIPGLRNLESLKVLNIACCDSLEQLENLSKLTRLSELWLQYCPELSTIEGTEKLMLSQLYINKCRSLQNLSELKKRSTSGSIDGLKFQNFL